MLLENFNISCDGIVTFKIPCEIKEKYGIEEDFWYQYSDFKDYRNIPNEIIQIPYILNIAPVIWISGLTFKVKRIDSSLKSSLIILKEELKNMYPDISWCGNIEFDEEVSVHNPKDVNKSIVLFSGGLDSLTTSFNHIKEKQILLSICGADVSLADLDGWELVKENAYEYASKIGASNFFVKSNFCELLINSDISNKTKINSWWGLVQHGMGLTSFMSIPSFVLNVPRGYIASTHTVDFEDKPWGSKPNIDNNIFWTNFNVVHDCYEYSRQQKANMFISIAEKYKIEDVKLRVCYVNEGGENCCICEKCTRTITSLLVQGVDPNSYGFDIDIEKFIDDTMIKFKYFRFKFTDNEVYHWNDIVSNALISNSDNAAINRYLLWLKSFSFIKYSNKIAIYYKIRKNISKIKTVKKIYEKFK
ncbi:TPA: hypothetical protein ACX6QT_003808 [Photobacterium damselae]